MEHREKNKGIRVESKIVKSESNQARQGVISGILDKATKVNEVAKGIPMLNSITKAATPLLGIASRISSIFGFSKPSNESPTEKLKLQPSDYHVNANGKINTHELSVSTGNEVSLASGIFGSTIDEMSIDYIMSRPNLISRFLFATGSPRGTILYSRPIRFPRELWPASFVPTHQEWAANLFRYWRANIIFDIELACNHFHNGKLRFSIFPGINNINEISEFDDANSHVVAFGENTSHRSVAPFAANTQFLLVDSVSTSSTLNSVGLFVISVEVPLQVSNTLVNSIVPGIVRISAENVEFGVPVLNPGFITAITPPAADENEGMQVESLYTIPKQSVKIPEESPTLNDVNKGIRVESLYTKTNPINEIDTSLQTNSISDSLGDTNHIDLLHSTTAESVRSLKQLALAFSEETTTVISLSPGQRWCLEYFRLRTGPDPSYDHIDYILNGFGFIKGGMIAAIRSENSFTASLFLERPTAIVGRISARVLTPARCRRLPIIGGLEGISYVKIPYYQRTHCVRNLGPRNSSNILYPFYHSLAIQPDNNANIFRFSRAVADDFHAGYLLGLLPMSLTPV